MAFAATAVLLVLATLVGCKAENIFFSIQNESGETLHDVKVTYPGDVIDIETLSDSTVYGVHRHFDGSGGLSISYSTPDGHTYSSSGPEVTGDEKGEVTVSINGSNASFDTRFEESRQ
jgi:hypothetical protein